MAKFGCQLGCFLNGFTFEIKSVEICSQDFMVFKILFEIKFKDDFWYF